MIMQAAAAVETTSQHPSVLRLYYPGTVPHLAAGNSILIPGREGQGGFKTKGGAQ